jgi:hypothetical protein
MKSFFALPVLFVAFSAFAQIDTGEVGPIGQTENQKAPSFSAFAESDNLYVTLQGDCNRIQASLNVEDFCKADRMARNACFEGDADLVLTSTVMACPEIVYLPQVVRISLRNNNVTPELEVLNLKLGNETVRVRVKDSQ